MPILCFQINITKEKLLWYFSQEFTIQGTQWSRTSTSVFCSFNHYYFLFKCISVEFNSDKLALRKLSATQHQKTANRKHVQMPSVSVNFVGGPRTFFSYFFFSLDPYLFKL